LHDIRRLRLQQWLADQFMIPPPQIKSMNGDAGFRRYFRFELNNENLIAVDSPSDKCNNAAFITVQKCLIARGIRVPKIVAINEDLGFFCLSDLGDNLLADNLSLDTMAELYQQAIALLPQVATMQKDSLPCYDREFIQLELSIFVEWLLGQHLDITLTPKQKSDLQQSFDVLIVNAIEQPQVSMHRDFHSRNLMCLANDELGVIDFQDAVVGPITYDVVSLLRDCYVKWPTVAVDNLFTSFCQLMTEQLSLPQYSSEQWQRWFDLMGLQRHIKASGIFARLFHRDNKTSYLKDIPLTLSYIVDISKKYPELQFLHYLVNDVVLPALLDKETTAEVKL